MHKRKGIIMSFGDRLKVTRKQKGFSQEELAERLDVSRQSVTKWETGISYPEIRTLLELSYILEKDLDWLFSDEKVDRFRPQVGESDRVYSEDPAFIQDRHSLNKTIRQDLLKRMVHVLDGFEIVQKVDTDEFAGTRACIFYDGRVFEETTGTDPSGNESIQSFAEMDSSEIGQLLLPWDTLDRIRLEAQLQVAKKHL